VRVDCQLSCFRQIVKDDSEAEDVMQQTYVSAYAHLDQFARTARFSTWLTKIAVNEGLARVRQSTRWIRIVMTSRRVSTG
jgi:RNA polymerase sigma-70 factor (ECF subfamily)